MMGSRLMQCRRMFLTSTVSCVTGIGVKEQYDPPMKFLKSKSPLFLGKNIFLYNTEEQN